MKTLSRLAAAAAFTATAGLGTALAADAATAPATSPDSLVIPFVTAPCIVTGYSWHAEQEMAADHIGSDYVEHVVYTRCRTARRQSNGTWKYTDGKIAVIANNNGYIVTVWRR